MNGHRLRFYGEREGIDQLGGGWGCFVLFCLQMITKLNHLLTTSVFSIYIFSSQAFLRAMTTVLVAWV